MISLSVLKQYSMFVLVCRTAPAWSTNAAVPTLLTLDRVSSRANQVVRPL